MLISSKNDYKPISCNVIGYKKVNILLYVLAAITMYILYNCVLRFLYG